MLTVAVLGAVEARRNGDRLSVPAGKTTELLVRLALAGGSSVRIDALLDDLWPEGAGRNTLQSKVSQLRNALGDKDLVLGENDTYRLAIAPENVDASDAIALAARASSARKAGDPALMLAAASEGLALFRGDVLTQCGDWSTPHRARLDETRLGLLEDLMSARVSLGSGGELVGELETLVGQHPLRERLWVSLMSALYRGGRQADALAAYGRVRALLIEELGIDPGPELQALERDLLQQDAALGTADAPSQRSTPGNVPSSVHPLVGRDTDLGALLNSVGEHRFVTVVGPAGVGKTRLVLEMARGLDAAGGVWLVRLEAVDRSADLEQVVAESLHLPSGTQLRERLSGAQTILLLDNCEHVVEDVSALVTRLLADVPSLRVVATSQIPLRLDEEKLVHLAPLSNTDSVALFLARARAVRDQLVVDDDVTTLVEEMCVSLDGLPLAIELAAARARSLSVRDIAKRLDNRFALLRDPSSNQGERRRALAGAIGWSYDLLFPDDQRGLWALSCFAGSASIDALEHVLAALDVPSGAVVDTLTRLVDRSLVSVDTDPAGNVRYRLLDSIHVYAGQRLAEAAESRTAHGAHAGWYAQQAAWCDSHVRGASQPTCLAIARTERTNIDAALTWCSEYDTHLATDIANGFAWTWVVLGDGTAGATRIRRSLTSDTTPAARAAALLYAGWLEASGGNVDLAQADLDEAAATADQLQAESIRADVNRHRAFVALQQGRPDLALEHSLASLQTYRELGAVWETASSLVLAAYGALWTGNTAAASRYGAEAVEIMGPIGDSWGLVHAKAMLGGIAQVEHRFEEAIEALTVAADQSELLGFVGQAALHRGTLARAQRRAGHLDAAAATYGEALDGALASGDGRMAATVRLNLAQLLRATGDGSAAVRLLEENVSWYASAGGGDGALLNRCVLAAETADRIALDEILATAQSESNDQVAVLALDAMAHVSAAAHAHEDAARLITAADSVYAGVTHLLDDADRIDRGFAQSALDSSH